MIKPFFLFIGPSGVGKSKIIRSLEETGNYRAIRSVTTRAPRGPNDTDRIFVSRLEFPIRYANGDYFALGCPYGTDRYAYDKHIAEQAHAEGKVLIGDISRNGIETVLRDSGEHEIRFVGIIPPSEEELLRRLKNIGRFNSERWSADIADLSALQCDPRIHKMIVSGEFNACIAEVQEYLSEETASMRAKL